MPKDFRKKTFQKVLRGYASEEVDEYLVYVTEEYRRLEVRAADSERKLALLLKKMDEQQKQLEAEKAAEQKKSDEAYMAAVHEAEALLLEAETSAENIREAAALEAEKQLVEASETAKQMLDAAEAESKKARNEAAALYDAASEMYEEVSSFRDTVFSLYQSHIESVESIAASAQAYIAKVDQTYSDATGEIHSREEDEDDDADEDETAVPGEISDGQNAEECASDEMQFSEAEKEASEPEHQTGGGYDVYIDPFEEEDMADDESEEAEESIVRIDWKNKRALDVEEERTRVLNLRAVRDAMQEDDPFTEDDIEEDEADDSGDFEDPQVYPEDFEKINASFREMDSLFTEDKSKGELSLTDEFDIVFSNADSKRNVEEIRRQPTVAPEEPKKAKKHTKF
ncbi:MAG: DivIVA domain-containing protein [Clostridia bacterium]|nr:DivIVA domain-containing protein [Clostridia bacterium]